MIDRITIELAARSSPSHCAVYGAVTAISNAIVALVTSEIVTTVGASCRTRSGSLSSTEVTPASLTLTTIAKTVSATT